MEKGNFIRITPFIHVPDIDAALSFFNDLGFVTYFRAGTYAYVQRECAGVRLLQNEGDDGAPAILRTPEQLHGRHQIKPHRLAPACHRRVNSDALIFGQRPHNLANLIRRALVIRRRHNVRQPVAFGILRPGHTR